LRAARNAGIKPWELTKAAQHLLVVNIARVPADIRDWMLNARPGEHNLMPDLELPQVLAAQEDGRPPSPPQLATSAIAANMAVDHPATNEAAGLGWCFFFFLFPFFCYSNLTTLTAIPICRLCAVWANQAGQTYT
jgi:hypothetical protein